MRVENWNPSRFDDELENIAIERLVEAAGVVKKNAERKVPVGTVSRPMYQSGPYAGERWTARDAGQLKKSIRVVRKRTKSGKAFSKKRNIRIYCGNFLAFYAAIVEYYTPYLRPAFTQSISEIKQILGVK